MAITVLACSHLVFRIETCAFLFSDTINTRVSTCAAGIDPLCTEQVNKIYVYFFKPSDLFVHVVMVTRRGGASSF